jgi:hypothetical protein
LESARENLINDAVALVRIAISVSRVGPLAVPVQHVQGGYEKFMSVLLFVAGQVPGVRPDQVQQSV